MDKIVCDVCGKEYKNENSLASHKSQKHKVIKEEVIKDVVKTKNKELVNKMEVKMVDAKNGVTVPQISEIRAEGKPETLVEELRIVTPEKPKTEESFKPAPTEKPAPVTAFDKKTYTYCAKTIILLPANALNSFIPKSEYDFTPNAEDVRANAELGANILMQYFGRFEHLALIFFILGVADMYAFKVLNYSHKKKQKTKEKTMIKNMEKKTVSEEVKI